MKKFLILLSALSLTATLQAGSGCGGGGCSSKKGDKVEEKTEDKVSGASCGEKKTSDDTCPGKDAGESKA